MRVVKFPFQRDKVKTSGATDRSYSDNRSDMITMSIELLDILPCSVRTSYNVAFSSNAFPHGPVPENKPRFTFIKAAKD